MNRLLCWCGLFCMLLFQAPLFCGENRAIVVDAVGSGATRQDALHDAMRKAIYNAVGMYVSTKSVLKNNDYRQQVVIASDAVVTNYDELDVTEHNGMWVMKIRAKILPNELLKYCPQLVTSKVSDIEIGNLFNKREALKNADDILDDIFRDYCLHMFKFEKRNIRLAPDDDPNGENITFYVDYSFSVNKKYYTKIKKSVCALLDRMALYKKSAIICRRSNLKHMTVARRSYESMSEFNEALVNELIHRLGTGIKERLRNDDLGAIAFEDHYGLAESCIRDPRLPLEDQDYNYYNYTVYVVPKKLFRAISSRVNTSTLIYSLSDYDYIVCSCLCAGKTFRTVERVKIYNSFNGYWVPYCTMGCNPLVFSDRWIQGEGTPKTNGGTLKVTIPQCDARNLTEVYIYEIGNMIHKNKSGKSFEETAEELESKFWHKR